ncbi:Dda-like helicase [Paraconexibacter sp. AEG42_29]|uniref:Dda-like helicase n=1 Tax=Paraconexibacter sp. AEG42_29 TaxID=2997339 RepID=A0AAU7APS7_9ACTN
MMTVKSIGSQGADGYAEYLDAKTVAPERGDYYLGHDGEPVESPGRWLSRPETLRALGIDPGARVGREELVALMQGRRPGTEEHVRPAGPTGTRNAGVDVTLSAPKSVSVAWALAGPEQRAELEAIHQQAVTRTFAFLRDSVPLTTERVDDRNAPTVARDLHAAEFRHSTARGLKGRVPDPQLHSHLVVMSVVKQDGRIAAVRDRAMYRAAREGGAYYRAALAQGLSQAGYAVEPGTGKHGRYFELSHARPEVLQAFSGRSREIERAAREFEAREGRRPGENELQLIKITSRQAKAPQTSRELTDAWKQTAREHDQQPIRSRTKARGFHDIDISWGERVERALTHERATFPARELRATALEQAAGTLDPDTALRRVDQLVDVGRLIALENRQFTTRGLRELEHAIVDRAADMAHPDHSRPMVSERFIGAAIDQASERIGAPLSAEQDRALRALTGPERIAALEGQAGTGKGVVIDAAARVERMSGRTVIGVALAGATAQRLGQDSPALAGRTTTIASLLAQHDRTGDRIDHQTTLIVDEAGMVDTPTLAELIKVAHDTGAKLIAVGDGKQLPAIGPGGMFDRLTHHAPKASLEHVRRTDDPDERKAWRALRQGKPERALAHYLARGQLHLEPTRDQALEAAAARYAKLTQDHEVAQVALMSDGSTKEIDRLNARVQHLRAERGELTGPTVALPATDEGPHYGLRTGDLVTWRQIQTVPGQARIENGSRGIVTHADPGKHTVEVELVGSERRVAITGPEQLDGRRLGYAQHVVRQQGATVDRAIAVTGGWQTSRESAYVQASRARQGIDWHIPRDELGETGTDIDRVQRLADRMTKSERKTPSLDHTTATDRTVEHTAADRAIDLSAGAEHLTRELPDLRITPPAPAPTPDLSPEI